MIEGAAHAAEIGLIRWLCREFAFDPSAHAVELGAELVDEIGFPFLKVLVQFALPLAEPRGHVQLGGMTSLFFQGSPAAGNGLDLLGQTASFIELAKSVGVDFIAETTERFVVLLSCGVELLHEDACLAFGGYGTERRFEPIKALLDGLHLAADQDFADALDLWSSF